MKEGEPVFGGDQASLDNSFLLNPTIQKPKKSKKTLIIILLVVALILIGVGIFLFIKNNKNETFNSTIKTSFNRYANYLISSTYNDAEISEESWTNEKLEENLKNQNAEYFSKLIDLYDVFETDFYGNTAQPKGLLKENEDLEESDELEKSEGKYELSEEETKEKAKEEQLEYIFSLVYNINSSLQKIKAFNEIPKISTNDMIKIFTTKGREGLIEDINNTYRQLSESEEQLSNYGALKIEIANLISDLYYDYLNAGCIKDNELSEECIDTSALLNIEKQDENQKLIQYLYDVDFMEYRISSNIISLSYSLYNELNYTGVENE